MDKSTIIASIIGASATIIAALIPLLLKKRETHHEEYLNFPHEKAQLIRFTCDYAETTHVNEVHIAGSFNHWLQAKKGLIKPTKLETERFAMIKQKQQGRNVWVKDVLIPYGHYDFKFVVNKNQWIAWSENSTYSKGNDAPGGPNLRIESHA
ncbi:MAG: hypothetical protein OEY38_13335 [Gammaproteobacteria bacterium]|nr:hypothetical protein [Gammaproteobacteria bacterium]